MAERLTGGVIIFLLLITSGWSKRKATVYHLGPTGLFGTVAKKSIKVTKVDKDSPADGKIKKGDEIIGAGTANFQKDVRKELAKAINEAETEKAGGKLKLILKGNKSVVLQLQVLGSYSDTAPYDCPKSEKIIRQAAENLITSKEAGNGKMHSGLLGLMATGEKKYIDVVAEEIKKAKWAKPDKAAIDDLLKGGKDMGYVGWYWGYNLITLGEYYLLTGDKSVLPAIEIYATALARGQDAGGLWGHRLASPNRYNRLPGYAQMNQSSLSSFMGMLFAKECGISNPDLNKGIATTYKYFESFVGRGGFPYGVHGPRSNIYNNNGTSGSAAICMQLADNKKGTAFFSQLSATTYDGMESGHASTWFNAFWTPLGSNLSGPEVTQQFFDKSLWLQTLYRSWDGSFQRFDGGSKEGPQAGTALLAYCLPRKVLIITGKNADKSIWLKGEAATEVIEMSKVDYTKKSTEELIELAKNHRLPQVRRAASGALGQRLDDLKETYTKFLESGTTEEKMVAVGQYGWWIAMEKKADQLDRIGAILRDQKADTELRVAAAGSVAYFGEPAYKYYWDIIKLLAEKRPDDHFGDIDWALGSLVNKLCADPFKEGLVKDKKVFYEVALRLAKNKRQHVRADGMRMLSGMPLEDFHIVADTVKHIIEDIDPTYHSYHSPGGPVGGAITILANLNIEDGIKHTLDVLETKSGKWGFKVRMVMAILPKYGANAKDALKKLQADKRLEKIEQGRFGGPWRRMVQAIENDKNPRKLISWDEAVKAGQ